MIAWSNFYGLVLPHVPDAPEPAIDSALIAAAREFCQDTQAVQATLDPYVITVGESTLPANALTAQGMAVHRILSVKANGEPLQLITPADVDSETTPAGGDMRAAMWDGTTITIYPAAQADTTLTVRAVVQPSIDAPAALDLLHERFAHAIAHGAVAKLALIYNPAIAGDQMALFERAKTAAKVDAFYGFSRARRVGAGRYF